MEREGGEKWRVSLVKRKKKKKKVRRRVDAANLFIGARAGSTALIRGASAITILNIHNYYQRREEVLAAPERTTWLVPVEIKWQRSFANARKCIIFIGFVSSRIVGVPRRSFLHTVPSAFVPTPIDALRNVAHARTSRRYDAREKGGWSSACERQLRSTSLLKGVWQIRWGNTDGSLVFCPPFLLFSLLSSFSFSFFSFSFCFIFP